MFIKSWCLALARAYIIQKNIRWLEISIDDRILSAVKKLDPSCRAKHDFYPCIPGKRRASFYLTENKQLILNSRAMIHMSDWKISYFGKDGY
jgi:hypothetical protein